MNACVLVEIKAKNIDKTYTYKIPNNLINEVIVGKRVYVPFGKQKIEGFVLEINDIETDYELKEIIEVIDEKPVLNEELLELGKYIHEKTLANLITSYQTMLPTALKAKTKTKINKKYEKIISLISHEQALSFLKDTHSIKAKSIINLLLEKESVLKKEVTTISVSATKTLLEKGLIKETEIEVYRINQKDNNLEEKLPLTDEQDSVVKEITHNINSFIPYLLHGVTGSGKTEVYMHIIDYVLKNDKEVIMLVPEISLTPQMVNRFQNRFGSKIAILHSGLSDGEKYDEWRKIENKDVKIVIGARSAIFAPFTNIGLIIIDEEHSNSYKQDNNPRYNTVDIALWRAKRYNCPLILGSATPSIETYTRAKMNVYKLLELKNRVNHNLPNVKIVDMKDEIKHGHKMFSRDLIDSINEKIDKGEQVILLLNRRGYSTIVSCHDCGYTHKCPNCDIPLTYHKSSNIMRCHYCGYGTRKLDICPECNSSSINQFGVGTQKLEEEINTHFSEAKVVRMDLDTTTNKGSHEKIFNDFKNEKYNILIGTQMIAKGLDFPKVTLVGVLNGDTSLNIPDFRSAERTYQLLSQVAGRAGRNELKGEVIIQCFNTDHYSIEMAKNHDYAGFYNTEIDIRKKLKYPPFYNLALIKIFSKDYDTALEESNKIGSFLRKKIPSNNYILGPSVANILKINNVYRFQCIIKYKKSNEVIPILKEINELYRINNKVNVDIDINPSKI